MIVVHDYRRPGRGLLCDRVRKGLVELAVPLPRLVPDPVETRAARVVEQAVVQEPQRAVGDHVGGCSPDLGRDGDHPQLQRVLPGRHGATRSLEPICLREGRGDPERSGTGGRRLLGERAAQARCHAAGCRPKLDVSPGAAHERERTPVRHHDEAEPGHATRTRARREATFRQRHELTLSFFIACYSATRKSPWW